ncbi:NYN domain-containing protein [Geminocystis sp. GBBB08]|uniref:NYN domain-containing protein n=1 Tax=Geminocystis sp. GBBB08 TaxID=2604140 RepID=UPI0027E3AB42|nr:NYN domain-containing protein [Geminocystis sp. GBBB08]MBL1211478.1 NYN domain-containing protein [Geminocystis sp. GBBB08]
MVSTTSQAILLVDGYNIIGTWHGLKKIRDNNGLEHARDCLIESLINYTGYKGLETKIVFDAHYQKTPSYEEKYGKSLSIYFTSYTETADTYIEKFCASFPRRNPETETRIIVATSDQAQRHTVVGYGAEWMSAQRLEKEIDTTKNKEKRNLRPRQKSQGRFLVNSLDSKTQKALSQMRFGI